MTLSYSAYIVRLRWLANNINWFKFTAIKLFHCC